MKKENTKSIIEIQQQRRKYVNEEFSKRVKGTHMSNKQKTRLFKKLWRIAKKKFK